MDAPARQCAPASVLASRRSRWMCARFPRGRVPLRILSMPSQEGLDVDVLPVLCDSRVPGGNTLLRVLLPVSGFLFVCPSVHSSPYSTASARPDHRCVPQPHGALTRVFATPTRDEHRQTAANEHAVKSRCLFALPPAFRRRFIAGSWLVHAHAPRTSAGGHKPVRHLRLPGIPT